MGIVVSFYRRLVGAGASGSIHEGSTEGCLAFFAGTKVSAAGFVWIKNGRAGRGRGSISCNIIIIRPESNSDYTHCILRNIPQALSKTRHDF